MRRLIDDPSDVIYCLARCADGRWLLLDRRYKPHGLRMSATAWADYDTCPGVRVWLRERDLRRLDGGLRPYHDGDDRLWLYHDATRPTRSGSYRSAYERRLEVLREILGEAE